MPKAELCPCSPGVAVFTSSLLALRLLGLFKWRALCVPSVGSRYLFLTVTFKACYHGEVAPFT